MWTDDPSRTLGSGTHSKWAGSAFDIVPFTTLEREQEGENAGKDVSMLSARALYTSLYDKIHHSRAKHPPSDTEAKNDADIQRHEGKEIGEKNPFAPLEEGGYGCERGDCEAMFKSRLSAFAETDLLIYYIY